MHLTGESIPVIMREQVTRDMPAAVINLDVIEGLGTHWASFYRTKSMCFYFDSYGAPPPEELVIMWRKLGKKVIFSELQIQDLKSTNCGFYCVGFLASMLGRGTALDKYHEFLSWFDYKDKLYNDEIILENLGL